MEEKMIARYKLLGRLGAGGMGEVYKALDTKMRREVALKLLPPHFVSDPERVARFKHEAFATSALNHPNITTIFEIDEADGQHYISLEYIAGRSLREQLRTEPLDLRQILDIAAQIAEGLHAAHEAGVVHRDLKPENVMVRPDGITKVLDFGLAKLGGAHELPSATEETLIQGSPGSDLTQPGVVLGTVAYMSPEQARGQPVDRRSDIFTFGSILLEMLTGNQAFQGPSAVEIMHAIIHDTPRALQTLGSGLPTELLRIVRKALAKSPSERYQTAKDIAIDLRMLQRDIDSGAVSGGYPVASGAPQWGGATPASGGVAATSGAGATGPMSTTGGWVGTPAGGTAPAGPGSAPLLPGRAGAGYAGAGTGSSPWPGSPGAVTVRRRRPVARIGLVAGLVVVVGAMVVFWLGRGERAEVPATAPVQPMQMTKLTDTGQASSPAFSPKGQYLAYTNSDPEKDLVSIRIRHMATGHDQEVVPAQPNVSLGNLVFSPDDTWLLYTRRLRTDVVRTLWQVSPLGGAPREVLRDIDSSPSFAPDGKRFVFQRILTPQDIRFLVATFGAPGEPTEVHAAPEGAVVIVSPAWSPVGNEIAYQQIDRSNLLHRSLMIKNLDSGETRHVPGPGWMQLTDVEWSRDGKSLYVAGSRTWGDRAQIWSVGAADGAVRAVTTGFDEYRSVAVRHTGSALATVRTMLSSHLYHVPLRGSPAESGAQARQITRGTGLVGNPRVSPDGTKVAVVSEAGGEMNIWVMDVDGTNSRQVTFGASQDFWQAWAPDGRRLVYASEDAGDLQVWVVDADGQNARQLTHDGKANYAPSWSPDGRWISYIATGADSSVLYKIPVDGGEPVRLSTSERLMMLTEWSPDGKSVLSWIQPQKPSPQYEAGIFPADGAGEVRKVPFMPRSQWSLLGLRWTPDGKGLSTCAEVDGVWTLQVYPLDGGAPRPRVSFAGEEYLFNYGWSRDGSFIIAQRGTMSSDVVLLENVP